MRRATAIAVTASLLAAAPAARGAATEAWTGAAPSTAASPTLGDWQNAANWSAGPFADGDSLGFGLLPGCASPSACYTTTATLPTGVAHPDALGVSSLVVGDDLPYDLLAAVDVYLSLDPPPGTAGISAAPTGARLGSASIIAPITLGDSQQWSVAGDGAGSGGLSVLSVDGAPDTLGLSVTGGAKVYFTGLLQTGGFTATGGAATTPAANGTVTISTPTTDPGTSPVTVSRLGLTLGAYSGTAVGIGPLSVASSALTIGDGGPNGPGTTSVAGDVSIDGGSSTTVQLATPGTVAGSSYGQLVASGDISVGGQLSLVDVGAASASCPPSPTGGVATLISTSGGALSGHFANLPDGSITDLTARCAGGIRRYPVAVHYTPAAVTATFLAPSPTRTRLRGSAPTIVSGTIATFTATVAPAAAGAGQPSGSVRFLDGRRPIACGNGGALTSESAVTATCATRLPAGSHTIRAVYDGDGAWAGSDAATTVRVVRPPDGFPRMGSPRVRGRAVRVPVSCSRGGGDCVVRLSIAIERTVHRGRRFISRTVTLGEMRRTIDAGRRRTLAVRLNPAGRRAVEHRRRLPVALVLERVVAHRGLQVSERGIVLRGGAPIAVRR